MHDLDFRQSSYSEHVGVVHLHFEVLENMVQYLSASADNVEPGHLFILLDVEPLDSV